MYTIYKDFNGMSVLGMLAIGTLAPNSPVLNYLFKILELGKMLPITAKTNMIITGCFWTVIPYVRGGSWSTIILLVVHLVK